MNSNENELVGLLVKSQQGDREAYRLFLDQLFVFLGPMVRSRAQYNHDDLIQEVMLSVHQALHTYDVSRPFLPWLNAIVNFRIQDQKRNYWRHQRRVGAVKEAHDLESSQSDLGDKRIKESLQTLPENQRAVVTLLKLQGYSLKEVAGKMRISVSAVKNLAHRGYNSLRSALTEESDEI